MLIFNSLYVEIYSLYDMQVLLIYSPYFFKSQIHDLSKEFGSW